jgi:hypothetical protein
MDEDDHSDPQADVRDQGIDETAFLRSGFWNGASSSYNADRLIVPFADTESPDIAHLLNALVPHVGIQDPAGWVPGYDDFKGEPGPNSPGTKLADSSHNESGNKG